MQAYWVYMLRCSDGSYYTDHTDNLEGRLWQHQQGLAADWTRRRRPMELVWSMAGDSRDEVFAMERRIKSWSRAKKEALIAGDWTLLSQLAVPPSERETRLRSDARPSTSLRTSESNFSHQPTPLVPPEPNSLVLSEVEGRCSAPLVPSEVEGRCSAPLVPSRVEGRCTKA